MSLSAKHIYTVLSEWPDRVVGSEDEMMAREALTTELLAEPDLELAEEGLRLPKSAGAIEFVMVISAVATIWLAASMPYISLLVGLFLIGCFMLHLDGRRTPFDLLVPSAVSANLVAKKGQGNKLYIVCSSIDVKAAGFGKDIDVSSYNNMIFYGFSFLFFWAFLIPVFYVFEFGISAWLEGLVSLSLISLFALYRLSLTGDGGNNLSGVAAASASASALWRKMPQDTEVRLVVSTGGALSGYGLEHYLKHHADEFEGRDVCVLNYDTPHGTKLAYIEKAGGLTSVYFENIMQMVAKGLVKLNPAYRKIRAIDAGTKLPESIIGARMGYKALTVTSKLGPEAEPDLDVVNTASKFGEAILRMLPEMKGKRDAR